MVQWGVSKMTITVRTPIEVTPLPAEWRVFAARIRGVTPLLMNNPQYKMNQDDDKAKRKKDQLPPEQEAELGLYRSPEGWLYLGADQVREAILEAAKGYLIKRKPLRPVLAASLFILDPYFPIMRDGKYLTTYDRIDIRRAVVQKQGILRARPLIEVPWEVAVRYQYDASLADPAHFVRMLQEVGTRIGVLDYRPATGGIFGRFEVVEAWTEDL
jgi:hypothetical protein